MFKFSEFIEVRFRDLDAFNHVNNSVYLTYLEQTRLKYMQHLGLWDSDNPTMVLARIAIDYRSPVVFGETAQVKARVTRVGRRSFGFAHEIWVGERLCAEAETVQVWFDFVSQKSTPIPARARAAFEAFEGCTFALEENI